MKIIIFVFILSMALISSCGKKEITDTQQNDIKQSSSTKTDKISSDNTEILAILENTEITISGVYGKFENGTNNVVRGHETGNKREFIGKLKDITNLQVLKENGNTIVSCTANVEGKFFKTINPCGIQAIIEKDSDNKLYISTTTLLEDTLPDITPTVPFDVNYAFESSDKESTTIKFSITGKEYEADKELYTFENSTMEYDSFTNGRDAGGTYYITIPFDKEHIKSLEIVYLSGNNTIEYNHVYMVATLSNNLKIYGNPTITYFPAHRIYPHEYDSDNNNILQKDSDYWIFSKYGTWSLDSRRKK